jgi:hypothetical protein
VDVVGDVVMRMDRVERLARIRELQEQADEGRARIAERERQREEDPLGFDRPADRRLTNDPHDLIFGESREPLESPPVKRNGGAGGLVYKRFQTQPAPAPEPQPDYSGWEQWLRGHLDIERQATREEFEGALVEIMGELRKDWHAQHNKALIVRDRRIAALEGELREVKGLLADTLKRFDQNRTYTEKLEADRVGLKTRLARLEGVFAGRMTQLAGIADAAGLLPRGYE